MDAAGNTAQCTFNVHIEKKSGGCSAAPGSMGAAGWMGLLVAPGPRRPPPREGTAMTHFRTCNLCEAMCGLRIETSEGRVTSIRGDEEDPFSQGHICPKAVALQDLHEDPDRLRQPVRRTATGWQPISWEEALDETARRLHAIQREHGKDAVGVYVGNPTVHNHGAMMFLPLLLRALRTKQQVLRVVGGPAPPPARRVPDVRAPVPHPHPGHRPHALHAHPRGQPAGLQRQPDDARRACAHRLKAIQQRGGRVVVVDPRQDGDGPRRGRAPLHPPRHRRALPLALLHVLLEEAGPKLGRLAELSDGLATVRELARGFTPERAAPHTGVPAETTRRIARELSAAEAAVCYGRVGVSTQAFGAMCQWLINVLNIVTGNLDRPGGALFTRPAFDIVGGPKAHGHEPRQLRPLAEPGARAARVRRRAAGGRARRGDPHRRAPGSIRAMVTSAGNPVLSTPNGRQLDTALASLDFMVCIDPYINETTRHAHIILPPSSQLERSHYDLAFHVLAVRNTAKYSPAALRAGPGRAPRLGAPPGAEAPRWRRCAASPACAAR